jgi:hypothetical protein
MILLVTYDLKGPAGSYSGMFDALKAQTSWWHYLHSTWLVDTKLNEDELFLEIKPHLVTGDRVLIVRIVNGYTGWLPEKAWKWMANRGMNPNP